MLGVGVHLPLPSSLGAQPGQELDEAMAPPLPSPTWEFPDGCGGVVGGALKKS